VNSGLKMNSEDRNKFLFVVVVCIVILLVQIIVTQLYDSLE
jgi:hypothetical protein